MECCKCTTCFAKSGRSEVNERDAEKKETRMDYPYVHLVSKLNQTRAARPENSNNLTESLPS